MKIEVSPKAERQLENIQRNRGLLVRLFDALDELEINPFAGKILEGKHEGTRSFRVGDYRIIYEIDADNDRVLIIRVGKRSEVYK
ncbi:MAG: type II toxin-antitoxin system RelE/ParE family toxin [Calditrichota bacterium]